MGFVYDEDWGDDADFTLDEVKRETNVAQLIEWLDYCSDRLAEMQIQVECAKACESDDEDWFRRVRIAMTFSGIGKHHIEKRLKALGVNPHPKPVRGELEQALRDLGTAKANLEKARSSATFGRALLDALRAHVQPSVFAAITADAADRAAQFVPQIDRDAA